MIIWLVSVGEPPYFDSSRHRRMRMAQICEALLSAGDRVTYWTSTFIHAERRHALHQSAVEEHGGGLTSIRLHSPGYRKHVSLARLRDQRCLAREFRRLASTRSSPELILCSYPSIELAYEATRYGAQRGIPVIVDVRDMWPDLFAWILPAPLRPLAHLALIPYRRKANAALARATALTGITDAFLDWAVSRAGRRRTDDDRAFPFCYEEPAFSVDERTAAAEFWQQHGVSRAGSPVVLYIGSLNRSFDLRPIITCARELSSDPIAPLFVLCGTGDMESVYRSEAVGIPNVIMPGWIDGCQIRMILELAAIAIGPLPDRPDFRSTINNKFVEYLSGSLPVLVSPADCYAARLVIDRDCGRGFDLDRPGSLAALLRDALADEGLLSRWAANAKSLFDEKFRADYVLPRWVSYLHGMAASTSPKQ